MMHAYDPLNNSKPSVEESDDVMIPRLPRIGHNEKTKIYPPPNLTVITSNN